MNMSILAPKLGAFQMALKEQNGEFLRNNFNNSD